MRPTPSFREFLWSRKPEPPSVDESLRLYADDTGSLRTILPDGTDAPVAGEGVLPDPTADGDVLTVVDGEWAGAAGGGSQPGAVRVLEFPFDFTMAAALNTGVPVWTPAADDWLLDFWIETDAPGWVADGAKVPRADIGLITAGAWETGGFMASAGSGIPTDLSSAAWTTYSAKWVQYGSPGAPSDALAGALTGTLGGGGASAVVPLIRLLTNQPVSLVVSDDGSVGGGAFDGSAGASTLYLVVSSPVATP